MWILCIRIIPCSKDLSLKDLTEELDIRCSSNFKYTLKEKSTLKLLACFPLSLVWYQAEPKNTSCPSNKHQDRGWWVPACPHRQHCHRHNPPQRSLAVKRHMFSWGKKKKRKKTGKISIWRKVPTEKKSYMFPESQMKKKNPSPQTQACRVCCNLWFTIWI